MTAHKTEKTFAERVRNIVKKIPYGTTLSYKEVAIRAGNPRGARAVARLMAANFDTGIPCHRVICSDGTPGGYNRGGVRVKKKLLLQEQSNH
jgi:O-6-methylguanine DNA methyltransferase